jgi:CHAT domain-containing protein
MYDIRRTLFCAKSSRDRVPSLANRLLLLLSCSLIIATDSRAPLTAFSMEVQGSRNSDAALKLMPGSMVTEEISGGDLRRYEVQLNSRQYLQLSIDKDDLNLAITLYGPNGQQLFGYTERYYGPQWVSFIAELPGTHQLEVRSLEKEAAGRRYQLRIEEIRRATTRDAKDCSALKLFAEAHGLRGEWEEMALRKALEKYTQAWQMWLSADRPRKAVRALMNAAEVHVTLSEYRQAINLYQKALNVNQRLSDQQGKMESLNRIGRVSASLGENDQAERHLTRVLQYYKQQSGVAVSAPDERLNAEALSYMGEVSYSKGDLIKALDFIKRALAMWTEVGDRRGEAAARRIFGHTLIHSGDPQKALTEFERAMALYRAVEDRRGEALSVTAKGTIHSLAGEEQLALASHLEARSIFRRLGDHQSEGVTLNGIGQAYEDLNEKLTALDNYKQALKLFEGNEGLDFAAGTEYEIARLYRSMNNLEQALVHYKRCITLSQRTKKRRIEAFALRDIATIYSSKGRRRETLGQYNKVLKLYRDIGDLRGQAITLLSIGDLFYMAGEKQKALDFYKQALPLARDSGDREKEVFALYQIARAARDCDALDDALSHIEQSLQLIETLRTYVSSPDLRSSYFASVRQNYGLYIDLLMQLDRRRPGQGFAALALRASESARARSLLEVLGEANMNIRYGVDQSLLERERHLEQLLNAKAQYRVQLSSSKQTQAEAAEVSREIRQLTAEYQVVQAQLRESNPRYVNLTRPDPLSLKEIQAEIRDGDTILLEYYLGDERSYLWAVSSDSFSSYELPARATLEEAAREVYALLTARQRIGEKINAAYQAHVAEADRQYGEKALALSQMLLGPVVSQLGNKRLLVVTEGVLQYIPFEALPSPDAEQTGVASLSLDDLPLLVSRHEIISLPSISTLAAIRKERPSATSPKKVVAILADPVFEQDDPRVPKAENLLAGTAPAQTQPAEMRLALRDFGELNGVPRLPYTLQEAEAILALTSADKRMVATGFQASRATVINSQLSQYQVVHFATHGLIDNEHPELSGILLSFVNERGEQENGFLQLHDIYSLNLSSTLVVLSACRTGLGKDVTGEGLVGLTRGFMYAGSKSVLASLWKVDDRATAELMGHFYSAMLRDKLPPAAALRQAKETLRRQTPWRAPYYWAAFVLQGEYHERVHDTENPRQSPAIIIASLAALICLLCLLYFIKRKRKTVHLR